MSDDSPTPATDAPAPAVESGQPEATTQQTPTTQQPVETQNTGPSAEDRLRSQVRGMQHLVDPLTQAGLKTPDDVQNALQSHQRMQEFQRRGIDVNALLDGTPPQPKQTNAERPLTRNDLQDFFVQREQATAHTQADAAATQNLRQFAQQVGGEYADDVWDIVLREAGRYLSTNGTRYPPGHPMHESAYVPPSGQQIEEIKQAVSSRLARIRGAAVRTDVDQGIGQQIQAAVNPNEGAAPAPVDRRQARLNRINELMNENLGMLNRDSVSNS